MQQWKDANTKIEVKQEFYDKREKIINEIKSIMNKVDAPEGKTEADVANKDSKARTTAADDTKGHRTNRLHTYTSTTTVIKSTRRQRQTLGNQSKVHGL